MYNGYTFDHRKEPTYAQMTDALNEVAKILGKDKFLEWVDVNFTPHTYCYTNQDIINLCNRELVSHECHCNGVTTCETCQSKALAATDQEIPY